VAKIIINRNSKYGIDKGFIRPKQFRFCNQEECISLYASLWIIYQIRKFENKRYVPCFFEQIIFIFILLIVYFLLKNIQVTNKWINK